MITSKHTWLVVAGSAAAVASLAVKHGVNHAWKLATDEDPPQDPTAWDVEWRDAIAWTVATGVLMGLAGLLARRGAAAGWHRYTGKRPPA